jgi:chemotaxis response regulator CheB
VRIGIVDERADGARTLRRAVALARSHQIIWVAESAGEALDLCAAETPDLVLIEVPMSRANGADVTRQIMAASPCPILLVTENVRRNAAPVFEAIGYGALDAVDRPPADSASLSDDAAPLLAKIDMIGRRLGAAAAMPARKAPAQQPSAGRDLLVTIGASAGGPAAVSAVLKTLPHDFPAAIVVVQHLDEQFVAAMAAWLSDQSGWRVEIAKAGDRPSPGTVLMAGAEGHLVLRSTGTLAHSAEPLDCAYRPSVDTFFHSVSQYWIGEATGILLTGMGRDGALGLKALRDAGHHTIAQDQATSAVYGMPKAAVGIDAAIEILPVERIGARLVQLAASPRRALARSS